MSTSHLAAHAHGLVPEVAIEQPVGSNLVDGVGTLDFGSLSPSSGTVEKTFTIRNTGAVDLSLGSITKDGANSSDFAITALSLTTLAPGTSTTFTVTFAPAPTGPRSTALHIATNDADENPFDIALAGSG